MIPICLVTGFLGSGKTTLLKHIVARNRNRKLIYLVNEFCATDIDGALVAADGADVVTIPGGSIFCKCLATSFIGQMTELAKQHPDAAGLVIEASGMANPTVIDRMLAETGLDKCYTLARIVAVIDPGTFLKLRHTLPNVLAQAAAADTVVINKTDCHDHATIEETATVVRELNGGAQCIRAVRADVDLDCFGQRHVPVTQRGDYAACRDPHYQSLQFSFGRPVNLASLLETLQQNRDILYRVKGFAPTTSGARYVELAGNTVTSTPAPETVSPGLAVIIRGDAAPGRSAAFKTALQKQGCLTA